MRAPVDIAAIYCPVWHHDARQEPLHGAGWSEWELVRAARPRFPGHHQPLVLQWGYVDETDPTVIARACAVAAEAGIDAFLWDWYWYDGDFLNAPLDQGYLNIDEPRAKFAIMWANHDWREAFPAENTGPLPLVWPGGVDAAGFERITDIVISRYLGHPTYWRVKGAAWFTIYRMDTFVDGLGGVAAAREALQSFRRKAYGAGRGPLHINAMHGRWSGANAHDPAALGIDSVGPYNWASQLPDHGPVDVDYRSWRTEAQAARRQEAAELAVPYIPSATMGWDSSARVRQDQALIVGEWPRLPIVTGNTPDEFEATVHDALTFAVQHGSPAITVNAWNEWTEGCYLEPEARYGDGYLRAIQNAVTLFH